MAKILSLILFSSLLVYGQGTWWKNFNRSNSILPSNKINAIAEDTNGNMWIGTDAGLIKFDGVNWTVFNSCNSGLPGDSIATITVSGDQILIGTRSTGFAIFNDSTWTVYNTLNSGLPDNDVISIAVDNANIIWLGTDGEGMAKFDGSTWTIYNKLNSGLHCNSILNINFDAAGVKWIGTYSGALSKYNGTTWKVFNWSNSLLNDKWVTALDIDAQDTKWIGTHNIGLLSFSGSTWAIFDTANSQLPEKQINAIAVDPNGNKWIGSNTKGLVKFDGTNWTIYNTSNSAIISNTIRCVFVDTKGYIWIGTNSNGLSILNENGPVVLPVELVSLTSSVLDNSVSIFWKTSTELDNFGWDIEKKNINSNALKSEANEWVRCGFLNGHGTTNATHDYSFTEECSPGKYVYRLKQINSDGSFHYSEEISVTINSAVGQFSLEQNYPNPFNPSTVISYQIETPEAVTLKIYNITGELVRVLIQSNTMEAGKHQIIWDAKDDQGNNIASGIYYYKLETRLLTGTKKMILLR